MAMAGDRLGITGTNGHAAMAESAYGIADPVTASWKMEILAQVPR